MAQEQILEGNKLIAEFMGGELLEGRQNNVFWFKEHHHVLTAHKAINQHAFKYHSSWDWIMPVVEKINASHTVKIKNNTCSIRLIVEETTESTLIKSVWKVVVEYVKYYNEIYK